MQNKLLIDLIRSRLNDELEKIRTELSQDEQYAADINDSVEIIRKELSKDGEYEVPPRTALHLPVEIVKEKIEPIHEADNAAQVEVSVEKSDNSKLIPEQNEIEQKASIIMKRRSYASVKTVIISVIFGVLLASAYFLIFR